jgi:hypothetical protein
MDIPLPFQIIDLDVQSNYSNDAAELPEVLSEQKEAQHFNYIWSKHPLYNNDTRFCGELPKEFLPLPSLPITYLKKKDYEPNASTYRYSKQFLLCSTKRRKAV